jgi:hypothetical protein
MTGIEEEVILLKAVKELIDSMVNFEVLDVQGSDPDCTILFRTMTHQRFFNIVLVDFLSCTDKKAPVNRTSYLRALKAICDAPSFDVDHSVMPVADSTRAFTEWLEQEVEVDTWLSSVNARTMLQIKRVTFLKMCGDISKHNFLRSGRIANRLQDTLARASVVISLDDALLALADFYERFHRDILNYHASTIAEFLNDIRWGIYEYLQPELRRSIVWEGGKRPTYRFTYPAAVTSRFARECYWELMNEVRSAPYVRRFQVTRWLKLRY